MGRRGCGSAGAVGARGGAKGVVGACGKVVDSAKGTWQVVGSDTVIGDYGKSPKDDGKSNKGYFKSSKCKNMGFLLSVVVVMMMGSFVGADEVSETSADPLSGLFVRQEATLRKLDGLIAKVGKVDDLEAKLDHVTNLLQGLEERSALLEAHLEGTEAKQTTEVSALVGDMEARLLQVENKMEVGIVEVESKIEAKMGEMAEMENRLDMKVEEMAEVENRLEARVERMVGDVQSGRSSQEEMIEATVEVGGTNESTKFETEACEGDVSDAIRNLLEAHHLNLSLTSETAMENLQGHLVIQMETALNDSMCSLCCEERLEKLMAPVTNATQHLVAAIINRIRFSNLAMDKRLAALLHTSSLRQRVLRETLLSAVGTLHGQVQVQAQTVYRKMEARIGELESTLAATVKLHTKGLAGQVLEAANLTLSSLASKLSHTLHHLHNTSTDISLTLHHLYNTSTDLHLALDNFTELHQEETPTICLFHDPQADAQNQNSSTSINGTLLYKYSDVPDPLMTQPHLMEETVNALQVVVEGRLNEVEDQLAGLRIYLSTSLHVHTTQVEERMSSVEVGLHDSVQQMLAKTSRTLDKLRRSSLGYLDAAVTSISSAAVASAQSTADQLKQELRQVTATLDARLEKVEASVRAVSGICPSPYQPVGGTCITVSPGPPAPWEEARERCRQGGGDLATLPPHTLRLLSLALPNAPSSYWIGGRLVDREWKWVTEDTISGEVSGEEGECLVVNIGGGVIHTASTPAPTSIPTPAPSPCHTLLPSLCQYLPPFTSEPPDHLNTHSNEVESHTHPVTSNELLYLPIDELNELQQP